ncbi:MAG: cupin domain-containing protein [Acidimicrobiia bacterium]|nr:cupin domain-containing protein [Acidimicrobiia bacterium]NNF64959.1 cupin domain-containing protein [Acidimicrobiia bacterium]
MWPMDVINLAGMLDRIDEVWSPRIVAQMNDLHVKLVKVEGEFVKHRHQETDELFLVISGSLVIELPDGPRTLQPGEMLVVPKGVDHRPVAPEPTELLLLEPAGTDNRGDDGGGTTGEWLRND